MHHCVHAMIVDNTGRDLLFASKNRLSCVVQVKMVGSTYRLTSSAKAFAKYLPLDTVSFRYIAWELDVQVSSKRHIHTLSAYVIFCIANSAAAPTASNGQYVFVVTLGCLTNHAAGNAADLAVRAIMRPHHMKKLLLS